MWHSLAFPGLSWTISARGSASTAAGTTGPVPFVEMGSLHNAGGNAGGLHAVYMGKPG